MAKKVITVFLIVAMMMTMMIQPVFATYQPELPSLYQTFNNYFKFGSFQGMSSFFGTNADQRNMLQHHYNSWSPANEFKPSNLLNLTSAASAYTTVYNEVNADGVIDEAESARLFAANTTLVLGSTSSQLTFLDQVRALNATRGPEDQVKVKAHTLFWHNLSQQPEAFFHEGFSTSKPWASKEVMLARIDSYIQKVFERFAPYKDVIYSWDVVNEAIDDFSGFIRNENDYQEGRWGRIFKMPNITDRNTRIYEEAVWVRQAFKSAAKYDKQYDLGWTLVYNDFYDADKDYEPKLSSTVEMLKPIYEQMKADGVTFAVGLQNRNATSLSLDVFKDMYNKFSAVCDEFQTTESDTRSDLVANPNYSRDALPYYLPDGITKNSAWTWTAWQNTPNAHVALVRSGWTAAMANTPQIMKEQADWQADQFDFLLENSKGNGGKLTVYAFDGVSDSSTFNSNKGAHIFMSADSAGNTNYTAKMSYYAMIGSVARFELKKKLQNIPDDSSKDIYTPDSWSRYAAARQAANDILAVRIYDLNGVNNVKNAASALVASMEGLTDLSISLSEINVNGSPLSGFAPGTHVYNMVIPLGVLPQVTATAADPTSKVSIAQAEGLPGVAVITVTSSDDSRQTTYTINFNVDTTLSSLKVDGIQVSGFSPDHYTYNMVVPYGSVPQVTAVSSDPGASVNIIPAEGVPGQAIIDVSAGGVKTTYTINFNADSSLKSLKVNGIVVRGFSPGTYTYNVYLPSGIIPLIAAVPNDSHAPVAIIQAGAVPGQGKVTVGSGSAQLIYTVNFSNNANANDEFNSATLNTSLWHWVNEDPATWSLASNPGYMTISPRAGDIYGSSTDAKNILLQNAPGDWTIETKIECSVRLHAAYQQGGIIAYQDMNNYIKLDWEATGSTSTIIQACREVNGSATSTSVNGSVVGSSNTLWLRMVKSGSVYTAYYSTDGTNFTQVGTNYTLNFSNVQAGLIAINGSGTNTDLNVKFDYFHNSANVFVPLPADKEALTTLINAAQALNELDYTTETWSNMLAALNAAITIKEDTAAIQADVDTACANLQETFNALEHRGAASLTGSDSIQPESNFTVGIDLRNITQNVYAEDMTLSYDPEVFEYVTDSVTGADPNTYVLKKDPSGSGTLRIVAANTEGVTGASTPILNVGFKVKNGVHDVTSAISITKAKLGVMPEGTVVQPVLSSKTIDVGAAPTVDKSVLEAAIIAAQAEYTNAPEGNDPGKYPAEARSAFLAAISAANAVSTNPAATQAEVNAAVSALATAKGIFEASVIPTPVVDKSELEEAIIAAQAEYTNAPEGNDPGEYPAEARAAFLAAISAANAVSTNLTATQAEVNAAVSALFTAKGIFEASVIPTPVVDKSELEAAINAAQILYNNAIVGTDNGCYRQADMTIFQQAIAAANVVFANSSATQEEVDNATSVLNTAKAAFEASVITASTGDLNNSATIDVGDLAIVAYYYGTDSSSENWAAAKVADLNHDGKVDIGDLAFIALRIAD